MIQLRFQAVASDYSGAGGAGLSRCRHSEGQWLFLAMMPHPVSLLGLEQSEAPAPAPAAVC